ncbi:MAG: 16S rRNA (guanine(527)-N(7))-methyltransferase RsmG [Syntrophomonadaceae bacterium]|nr:16S rRNA (guanine(527)-N(7))-methyltransferase RsmG [Syntrophomonadaceae bacterium]
MERLTQTEGLHGWGLLDIGLKHLALEPGEDQLCQFRRYAELLQEWNSKINLTAISDLEGIIVKHFLDSLLFWQEIKPGNHRRLCDVGSGAGFPGIPLKIMFPSLDVVLLEATGKKVKFMEMVIDDLSLKGITAVNARAEDYGRLASIRESFDIAISRAVATLAVIGEICLPLIRVGGIMVGLKGPDAKQEEAVASPVLEMLGGKSIKMNQASLPFLNYTRYCYVVEKSGITPDAYPRRPGIPEKRPLRV